MLAMFFFFSFRECSNELIEGVDKAMCDLGNFAARPILAGLITLSGGVTWIHFIV